MGGSRTWLVVAVCALVAGAGARAQLPRPESGPSTRPGIAALVEQLGDPRFSVRDRAMAELGGVPYADLSDLVRRYGAEVGHEQKLRLRHAIETVYYRELMTGQLGFLGITPWSLPAVYDPKTGQTVECLVANRVIEGSAAALGGMKADDIILEFEGQPMAVVMNMPASRLAPKADPAGVGRQGAALEAYADPGVEAFTLHVKRRAPGTHVRMRVLRAGEPRQVAVRLGDDPGKLLDADVLAPTLVGGGPYSGLISAVGGLAVKHVPEGSWLSEAKLEPGDAIVGIGAMQIPAGATVGDVGELIKRIRPRDTVAFEVRHIEQVALDITLGARTPDLMNKADWDDAQYRFAAWWREQTGASSFRRARSSYVALMGAPTITAPEAEVVP